MGEQRDVTRSWELWERAQRVIPMATQTHSKAPREALRGLEPCFIERGQGCRLWDLDGNEYLDYRCSLGPITLGYRYPAVEQAVRAQLERGTVFSYATSLEVEVAEALVEMVPCAESCRFLRTGGEAMSAAIKLARAFTGRPRILKCGYHGWLTTMTGDGVPEAVRSVHTELPWGDPAPFAAILAEAGEQVAAITVAYAYSAGEGAGVFLRALRELADRYGCLLVFDEIVTGFRLANGGAQQRFGVVPDLAVFSKGMANGWPISVYCGRRDVMETVRRAVISSTFGGEATALAATRAALEVYRTHDVPGHLEAVGKLFQDGLNALFTQHRAPARSSGLPHLQQLVWQPSGRATAAELALRFEAELLRRGVIIYSITYTNFSHTAADIATTLERADAALATMAAAGLWD
ncbi:MAG: aminotransferase class III-fold pyridoxal phosphate-dependent enzyme [Fimbriimonadaceae bacterium]|nr:aminotransferase class III-fold pyridoxal phosphate-dependent enzyme [Fimbriimonadaceae bacterium]